MATEPKTLAQAIQYFTDADNCLNYLKNRRWLDGTVKCPTCGRDDVTFLPARRLWQCKTRHPKAQFSIKTGTVLEDSPLGLDKWLPVMWMVANMKNGVSSWEIHRSLGVSQKTAWFMLHRIRLGMKSTDEHKFGTHPAGGECETDETFIGGQVKNMHKDRKLRYQQKGGNYGGKAIVHGILDRDLRQVRAKVIPNVKRETLQNAILDNVKQGSIVYSDEWTGYDGLNTKYLHGVITHATNYVNGRIHTNGIENFWSLLKRGLKGTYVAVEPFHLDRYIDEQAFRYNNRATKDNPLNDADRFSLLCSQIVGKRLTYAELTAKGDKKQAEVF
ncbi:MAG: IS1595 family transposase [Terriglobales bacterium]